MLTNYLKDIDTEYDGLDKLLNVTEGRKELTKYDPLLFALLYLPHHLQDASTGGITLSEFHNELVRWAADEWPRPLRHMKQYRDAFIAPRNAGKSTWLFTILPLWSAAQGHNRFTAAFADSSKQSEAHLATFKHELDNNQLLQADFPDLCKPAMRSNTARQLADNRNQIFCANGFIFMARGIDTSMLGMKVGKLRPDLIVLDDIEPGEAQYSAYQKEQRLKTVQDVVFPLNEFARVVISGTTVMPGSIIHELALTLEDHDEQTAKELQWIADEKIKVHYFPAIITQEDGTERSIWPERWPLDELQAMRHQRSFLKNFMNKPLQLEGQFWSPGDFVYQDVDFYGNTLLSIDPAVTKSNVSDYTGLAVVSRHPDTRSKVIVRHASHVKMSPEQLKVHILNLLSEYPEIQLILIETNQGGDLWENLFKDIPVKIRTKFQTEAKAIRAQKALAHYEKNNVWHTQKFQVCETEMLAFPSTQHDDVLDAVTSGVLYFLDKPKGSKSIVGQMNYL